MVPDRLQVSREKVNAAVSPEIIRLSWDAPDPGEVLLDAGEVILDRFEALVATGEALVDLLVEFLHERSEVGELRGEHLGAWGVHHVVTSIHDAWTSGAELVGVVRK